MKLIAQTTAIIMAVMLCHAQEPFKTTVFEGKTSGYEQFRIPALVITTKGTLLAFCAARKQAATGQRSISPCAAARMAARRGSQCASSRTAAS
jgi:hypothetical protein